MPLKRTETWAEGELHGFLLARASMPFEWGVNDCALFAADAIWAFTGTDLAQAFRSPDAQRTAEGTLRASYDNDVDALTAIWKLTGKPDDKGRTAVENAAEWCAQQAGLEELKFVKLAQRGDLLVMEDDGRLIAGIVHLNGRDGVSVGADGLKRLPMESWRRAWRV